MAEQVTCLINSIHLSYCESTTLGSVGREFVNGKSPSVKASIFTGPVTVLAIESELTAEESNELSALLDKVAARVKDEVAALTK